MHSKSISNTTNTPPGSIQNIVVSQNICVSPGTWIVQFELPPVESPNFFINSFILVSQIHLLTLKGMIYTTSLYPSTITYPGPGVINWSGYVVPMGILPRFGSDDDNVQQILTTSDWQELSNTTTKHSTKEIFSKRCLQYWRYYRINW